MNLPTPLESILYDPPTEFPFMAEHLETIFAELGISQYLDVFLDYADPTHPPGSRPFIG